MRAVRTLLLALAGLAGAGAAPAATVTFRAADTHPPEYPTVRALNRMGELLAANSGGRFRIQVFPSRQLGEEKETIEQTRSGAIDLNRVNLAAFNDVIPESLVPSLPFLFQSTAHMWKVLEGPVGEEILRAFEGHGLVGLAFYDSGARSFYVRGKALRTPADFRGLKLRVQQSKLFLGLVGALGAQGVALPYGQVLTAIETGLVDGAENNWPSYESSGHYKVATYYTLTEHSMAPEVVIMSAARWNALAPADRERVRKSARDSVPLMHELWRESERESEARAIKAGITVVRLTAEQKRALAEPVQASQAPFLANPRVKALVERVRRIAP